MLRDVFRFSDKRANELMTHRRDIVIFHPDDTQEEGDADHRRRTLTANICWWTSGKDEIIGVVSVKDIILMMGGEQGVQPA